MGIFQVMHLVKGTSDLRQLGLQVIDQTLDLGQQGCVAGLRLGQDAFLGVSLPWRGKVGFIMMTPLSPDHIFQPILNHFLGGQVKKIILSGMLIC
uniref:Uncharacterized protein n=1 Tax=Rousettus aegyptiacus TaxID=9407 RepID=A0A7J8GCC7_ROUAE|nr:hypothetical protein HJG63_011696 [Rousettus aegyptiacus]